jgi:hypothetical protein
MTTARSIFILVLTPMNITFPSKPEDKQCTFQTRACSSFGLIAGWLAGKIVRGCGHRPDRRYSHRHRGCVHRELAFTATSASGRIASKAVRPRGSSAAREETEVARLTRERDEVLQRQSNAAIEDSRLLNDVNFSG